MADTSIGSDIETRDLVNEIAADMGVKQGDALAAIVAEYAAHRTDTHGERAAADAIAVIEVQSLKLKELVEGAAQTAKLELESVREDAAAKIEQAKAKEQAERDAARDAKATADTEIADLKAQLEDAKRDAARLPGLQADIADLKAQFVQAERDKRSAEDKAEDARSAADAAKADNADIQAKLTAAITDKANAEAKLAEAEKAAEIDQLKAEAEIEKLQTKVDALVGERDAARSNVAYLEAQTTELRDTITALRQQLSELQKPAE